jgi:hypothetical protein
VTPLKPNQLAQLHKERALSLLGMKVTRRDVAELMKIVSDDILAAARDVTKEEERQVIMVNSLILFDKIFDSRKSHQKKRNPLSYRAHTLLC